MELTKEMYNVLKLQEKLKNEKLAAQHLDKRMEALEVISVLYQLTRMNSDNALSLSFSDNLFTLSARLPGNNVYLKLDEFQSAELAKFISGLLMQSYSLEAVVDGFEETPADK